MKIALLKLSLSLCFLLSTFFTSSNLLASSDQAGVSTSSSSLVVTASVSTTSADSNKIDMDSNDRILKFPSSEELTKIISSSDFGQDDKRMIDILDLFAHECRVSGVADTFADRTMAPLMVKIELAQKLYFDIKKCLNGDSMHEMMIASTLYDIEKYVVVPTKIDINKIALLLATKCAKIVPLE